MEQQRESPADSTEVPSPPDWAYGLVRVFDDAVRIPGTKFGFGLDGLLGLLFPGVGDAIGAVASVSLLVLAFQMRVPKVVLSRMVVNVAIDAFVGMVPMLGDLFDFAWRANKKNLELVEEYRGQPQRRATAGDYVFVGLAIFAALVAVALPIALTVILLSWLGKLVSGA